MHIMHMEYAEHMHVMRRIHAWISHGINKIYAWIHASHMHSVCMVYT